jgi:hypothetical protein
MITLFGSYGNHSNRLFQNLHFEAFCTDHGIYFSNPSFYNMCSYYASPVYAERDYMSSFLSTRFSKLFRKVKSSKRIVSFNGESDNDIASEDDLENRGDIENQINLLKLSSIYKKVYVEGWGFRAPKLTEKYQDTFVKKYSLKEVYYKDNNLLKLLNSYKCEDSVTVGIHVRRGDYKSWRGGKYYFEDEVYKKYMLDLKEKLQARYHKRCRFIIFSNGSTSFENDPETLISKEKWYIDHLLMSRCDLLVGPPSTFTLWASYIGKTKYYHILNIKEQIQIDDFRICRG